MKYCKQCEAELSEESSFCEKCGKPVGKAPKPGNRKKKWFVVISFELILLAAVAGGLAATGVIGGRNTVEQTSTSADGKSEQENRRQPFPVILQSRQMLKQRIRWKIL